MHRKHNENEHFTSPCMLGPAAARCRSSFRARRIPYLRARSAQACPLAPFLARSRTRRGSVHSGAVRLIPVRSMHSTKQSCRAVSDNASRNTKAVRYNVAKVPNHSRVASRTRLVWEGTLCWVLRSSVDHTERIVVPTCVAKPSMCKYSNIFE